MARGRNQTPDFEPVNAVALADTYYAAAVALWSQLRRIASWRLDRGEKPGPFRDMAPVHVLEGLAVEIYLKALLKHSNVEIPRKHDLLKLHEKLPLERKRVIQSAYDIHRAQARESSQLDARRDSMIDALKAMDNFNHEWRYFHEEGRFDQSFRRTGGYVELGMVNGVLQTICHHLIGVPEASDYPTYDEELGEQFVLEMNRPRKKKSVFKRAVAMLSLKSND